MAQSPTILCVGTPCDLKRSRQLVLQSAGYDTSSMDTDEAIAAMAVTNFALVVISATVSIEERRLLHQALPERTRVLQLKELTLPQELLTLVGAMK